MLFAETGIFRHIYQNGKVTVINLLYSDEPSMVSDEEVLPTVEEVKKEVKNFKTGAGLNRKPQETPEVYTPPQQTKVAQPTKTPGITLVKKVEQVKKTETDEDLFLQQMAYTGAARV